MNNQIDRLPAIPLITNDPFFSIWCAGDKLTDVVTTHWAGEQKPLTGKAIIDGKAYRFLGVDDSEAMQTRSLTVTPTSTVSKLTAGGVRVEIKFTTPLLLKRPDVMSMPVTYVDIKASACDNKPHTVALSFNMSPRLCYVINERPVDGEKRTRFDAQFDPTYDRTAAPTMVFDTYAANGLNTGYMGKVHQGIVGESFDHIAIDWGYAYLASEAAVTADGNGLTAAAEGTVKAGSALEMNLYAAYDDVASINYFGRITPAYYAKDGMSILDAIAYLAKNRKKFMNECAKLDRQLTEDAEALGGEDYKLIVSAAYRHSIAAHKLVADEKGKLIFISKENDSNGCANTVDVSYPSIPLYLLYNPDLVRGMCRPILKYASMPVWCYDFAPHDTGRYPHVTGQVYALKGDRIGFGRHTSKFGGVFPQLYLYPADADIYNFESQMPVEECGNMLIMLYAASRMDGDFSLEKQYRSILDKWVKYLIEFGEDPGDQLCTDDFAGHLARNINLSAKAFCGVAAYSLILEGLGDDKAAEYMDKAKAMAKSWLERATAEDGSTYLTFDKTGWSMKYNTVWDKAFGLGLLPDEFYEKETKSYIGRMNKYGLPLDSRADYTKSDWILWCAAMADNDTARAIIKPVADYLRESESRVAFSDWYFTSTGKYRAFIGRSVQGGLFMPLLVKKLTSK